MARPNGTADAAEPAGGRRGSLLWVQGLACGALLTFAAPPALLLAVLFVPSVICMLAETGPDRGMKRAVALGCTAASLGPVWHLWMAGDHMQQAIAMLSEMSAVLLAWGAGALAWALCQTVPVILRTLWDFRDAGRARGIEAELKSLKEAWAIDADAD